MVYGRYNYSIHGVYKPTNITGGHHPVAPAIIFVGQVSDGSTHCHSDPRSTIIGLRNRVIFFGHWRGTILLLPQGSTYVNICQHQSQIDIPLPSKNSGTASERVPLRLHLHLLTGRTSQAMLVLFCMVTIDVVHQNVFSLPQQYHHRHNNTNATKKTQSQNLTTTTLHVTIPLFQHLILTKIHPQSQTTVLKINCHNKQQPQQYHFQNIPCHSCEQQKQQQL